LDLEAYERALGPRTAVVSVMWANNETGTVFPVELLAKLAHSAGRAVSYRRGAGGRKDPINLKTTEIDMLSLSGTSCMGQKGSARYMFAKA